MHFGKISFFLFSGTKNQRYHYRSRSKIAFAFRYLVLLLQSQYLFLSLMMKDKLFRYLYFIPFCRVFKKFISDFVLNRLVSEVFLVALSLATGEKSLLLNSHKSVSPKVRKLSTYSCLFPKKPSTQFLYNINFKF